MPATFKEMTTFFQQVGADQVAHTDKGYLAHAIGVYNDLKAWGCTEEVSHVGLFHSIYGTEIFQGFTLPLERRDEIVNLIGKRAEFLSYVNCAMNRASFDAEVARGTPPFSILDRLTGDRLELTSDEFHDLCVVHLVDWLEQVARWQNWDYRRPEFRRLAEYLGPQAVKRYDEEFAKETSS